MAIAERGAFAPPIGDRADDEQGELSLATGILPAQRGDEFDVEVVDVSGGKGLHGGPRDGFLAAELFGSEQALAVVAAAAATVVFLFRSGQRIEASVLADAAEEGGARRKIAQHGAVGEGGVGADQQRASGTARKLIDSVSQMSEALCSAAADGGSGRSRSPTLPLRPSGIGAA